MPQGNFLRAKTNDAIFGNTPYSPPSTLYLALFTASPSSGGGGTEVSGGGYSRVAVANNSASFPATNPSTGEKFFGSDQSWPVATAAWGTVVAVAIMDASSGGNIFSFGSLITPITIASGDIFRIPGGSGGYLINAS